MLRLAKSLPFFNPAPEDALAQSFLVPTNGFHLSVPTKHGLDNYHGPGTVFQGQLNLQLAKPIRAPCRLRVVFSCLHTIPLASTDSSTLHSASASTSADARLSSDSHQGHKAGMRYQQHQLQHQEQQHSIFEIDNVLVQDEPLQVKRHTFMFNIKFPRVNLPASMMDGVRSLVYALHSELSFQTTPGDAATETTLCSPTVHLKYLPLIPTSIPHYPVIEMAQVMDPYSSRPLFKAAIESPQRGVCPGEALPFSLSISNASDTDLHSIHVSLVRVISYPTPASSSTLSSSSPPSSSTTAPPATATTHSSPLAVEPITVHSVTIPVSKTINKNSTWQENIQFKIPTNLGLVPTTNKVVTPLYKVDYYLSVSLPVASRGSGLASWFTPSIKNPPPVDISLIRNAAGTAGSGPATGVATGGGAGTGTESDTSNSRAGPRKSSMDKLLKTNLYMDRITTLNSTMKWPTLIQLPLVPVIIGTVPHSVSERQLRWPIPNYLDVMDRPCFIRDRFEEEMMQHLESLETLIAEEENQQDIENMVQAARKSASSGESDEEEQRARSRIPARFRNTSEAGSRRKASRSSSGLDTPPPSPPSSSSAAMLEKVMSGRGGASRPGTNTLPRVGRRSMSPKAGGLGKGLLLEMHHSKVQQSIHAGLQDI